MRNELERQDVRQSKLESRSLSVFGLVPSLKIKCSSMSFVNVNLLIGWLLSIGDWVHRFYIYSTGNHLCRSMDNFFFFVRSLSGGESSTHKISGPPFKPVLIIPFDANPRSRATPDSLIIYERDLIWISHCCVSKSKNYLYSGQHQTDHAHCLLYREIVDCHHWNLFHFVQQVG